jgi:thioredoxin
MISSFLVAGCGAAVRGGTSRAGTSDVPLPDGEVRLERALHAVDALRVEIGALDDAPGNPVDTCRHSDGEVIERDIVWKLAMGKAFAGSDEAATRAYYALVQEGTPAALMPIVYLRKYHLEGLRRCVLGIVRGTPQDQKAESDVAILLTSGFEAETSRGVVLVDFMTHWCAPCRRVAPGLEELARDYKGKLKVGWLDADRNLAVAQRFGIKAFPTLLILRNGKEVARRSDANIHAELRDWVERVLRERGGD